MKLEWHVNVKAPLCPECGRDTALCYDKIELPTGAHIIGEGGYPQTRNYIDRYLRCNCGWQSAKLQFSMGYLSDMGKPGGRWKENA